MKRGIFILSAAAIAFSVFSAPVVTDVQATGSEDGVLTVTYALSEDAIVTAEILSDGVPLDGCSVVLSGDVNRLVGADDGCVFTWNAKTHAPGFSSDGISVRVTAWPENDPPDYMVVDLCPVSAARVRYFAKESELPGGIVSNEMYRSSLLVMRRIRAKDVTWRMGSDEEIGRYTDGTENGHDVTLDHDYYIGVFEYTKAQFAAVSGGTIYGSDAYKTQEHWRFKPVERLPFNDMRGTQPPAEPGTTTTLGMLKSMTGFDFDLPTESEWEFAARAGHYDGYWGDGSAILASSGDDANVAKLARYTRNNGGGGWNGSLADTGMYLPNDWGLYDVHGNVVEFCLDWYQPDITCLGGALGVSASDPALRADGVAGTVRVIRGGYFACAPRDIRPARRLGGFAPNEYKSEAGYRLLARRTGLSTGWTPVGVESGETVSLRAAPVGMAASASAEIDTYPFFSSGRVFDRRVNTDSAKMMMIVR